MTQNQTWTNRHGGEEAEKMRIYCDIRNYLQAGLDKAGCPDTLSLNQMVEGKWCIQTPRRRSIPFEVSSSPQQVLSGLATDVGLQAPSMLESTIRITLPDLMGPLKRIHNMVGLRDRDVVSLTTDNSGAAGTSWRR